MKDATMKMIRESTPDSDGIIEIKSRYGTKRITLERLSEITMESFILGGLGREGTNKEQCRQIWNQLIEEEVGRVQSATSPQKSSEPYPNLKMNSKRSSRSYKRG